MEVFVSNLPAQGNLSDRGLRSQLQPFMEKLNIAEAAYDCEKAPKKRHAFVTFLLPTDGRRFLDVHGAAKRYGTGHRMFSRLHLLGASVMCKLSDRPPSDITLRVLTAQVQEAKQRRPLPTAERAPSVAVSTAGHMSNNPADSSSDNVFRCHSLSCGYYKFANDDKLAFVPEVTELYSPDMAIMRFGKRLLSIERSKDVSIYIPLLSVQEIVWSPHGSITLTLSSVPIFVSARDAEEGGKRTRLTAINDRHAKIVGMCLVYSLNVVPEQIHRKMQWLGALGGLTVTRYDLDIGRVSHFTQSERKLKTRLAVATTDAALPFPILLQLQALVYNGYLHPDTVGDLTLALCGLYNTKKTSISPEAMKKLFRAIDWPTPNYQNPREYEVPALLEFLAESEREIKEDLGVRRGLANPGHNLTPVYRAVVTPTRITLHGPELENKNRVLRKFPNHHDHFIRVQFCDEDGQNLRFNGRIDLALVFSRFRSVMINGIQIAGRTYKFLGWSHSSLRAHSMWFVAPFIDDKGGLQTHFSIISTLGNFSSIQSPARCAARIGQAFSETPFAVPIAANGIAVSYIRDVMYEERVFSDGVGTISLEAAEVIWRAIPRGKKQPTCFQIRYAGAKGMLSLDPRLEGKLIQLRPSMIKFESGETSNLEICDMASQPIPLYTNRQLIKILEDMGVPKSWFLGLQNDALRELRLITSSAYNMANFIRTQAVATAMKLHKVLLLADNLGLDYRSDPFLRRATDAVILRELRLLKHKARMLVPLGITLFGVMDETGFLSQGEVYVAFDTPKRQSRTHRSRVPPLHDAPLLVTRSPALHPGDIQLATNIIPPNGHPLRCLSNCIVFSASGTRDLPSQLSGGDLDGDIFNVIWDPDICYLDELKTFLAADYPRQTPVDIGHTVKQEDIADFFIDFIRTDHLGTIATRHMILADQLENGTTESECVAVAAMHSTAVDFSKTGIPADLKKLPRANRFRPDFLSPGPIVQIYNRADIDLEQFLDPGKEDNQDGDDDSDRYEIGAPIYKYYRSEKTLGMLYRAIDERQIWKDDIARPPQQYEGMDFYEAFLEWATEECEKLGCLDSGDSAESADTDTLTNWRNRRAEASRIRAAYEDAMINTMYEFSEHPTLPITELEVFIGTIVNKTGAQTLRQRDRSRKLRDEFERISGWISGQIRRRSGAGAAAAASAGTEGGWNGHGISGNNEDDDDDDDEDDDKDNDASGWLKEHQQILALCLACACSQKEEKLAGKKRSGYGARQDRSDNEVESFWLVAASALIQELEFIRHGLEVDAALEEELKLQKQLQELGL